MTSKRPTRLVFELGTILDGTYELRELLNEGPLGQVFGARDRRLERDVVIKVMWPTVGCERLRDEARALGAFQHPGLPAAHGLGTHAGIDYLVLERLSGMTLAEHLAQRARHGGFMLAETIEIMIGICDTLAVIHAAGMAHGSPTPEGVMLAGGRVVLFDLGGVYPDPTSQPGSRRRCYSPPETPLGRGGPDAGRLRDLYALGAIGFEMLTGVCPDDGETISAQLARACVGVPEPLVGLVTELLAENPADRPRAAELVAASLRAMRSASKGRRAPISVVVADDDPDVRELLGLVVRTVSPTAVLRFVPDGAEALRLVRRDPPDVLFLDLQMPRLNGLEVCMYLRGTRLGDPITICVISRFGESHRAVLKQLGVLDILVKGAGTTDDLRDAIESLFHRIAPGFQASPPPRSVPDPNATVAGRYVLERPLGRGGMGCVYEAKHLALGKLFALKIISPSFANDTLARARFNEEAKLASGISHPNIVSVVDYGEDPNVGAFMVMELLSGESLTTAAEARMSIRRACDVLGQIADALDTIHRRGIAHGDVKADNIMLVEEALGTRRRRLARLLDFGLAHRLTTVKHGDTFAGTPEYCAPERVVGAPMSVATDVYALGVLGYFLLAGSHPFEGETSDVLLAHIEREPPPLATRRDDLDPALEALIRRAMSKNAKDRHPSAAAFRYELNAVMDMLDIGRRRARSSQGDTAFARSTLAQAIISMNGDISLANHAFRALLGLDGDGTRAFLGRVVPDLQETARRVDREGVTVERRARLDDDTELVMWISPAQIGKEVHLVARIGKPAT